MVLVVICPRIVCSPTLSICLSCSKSPLVKPPWKLTENTILGVVVYSTLRRKRTHPRACGMQWEPRFLQVSNWQATHVVATCDLWRQIKQKKSHRGLCYRHIATSATIEFRNLKSHQSLCHCAIKHTFYEWIKVLCAASAVVIRFELHNFARAIVVVVVTMFSGYHCKSWSVWLS